VARGIDDGQHLLGTQEDVEQHGHFRRGAEAPPSFQAIAGLGEAVHFSLESEKADAIDVGLRAVDAAAARADFVFAREVREIAVVGEVAREFEKLRRGVDDFLRSMPATGQPKRLRVSSPHAPLVVMPTAASSLKSSGCPRCAASGIGWSAAW